MPSSLVAALKSKLVQRILFTLTGSKSGALKSPKVKVESASSTGVRSASLTRLGKTLTVTSEPDWLFTKPGFGSITMVVTLPDAVKETILKGLLTPSTFSSMSGFALAALSESLSSIHLKPSSPKVILNSSFIQIGS